MDPHAEVLIIALKLASSASVLAAWVDDDDANDGTMPSQDEVDDAVLSVYQATAELERMILEDRGQETLRLDLAAPQVRGQA